MAQVDPTVSHAEARRLLERVGTPPEVVAEILAQLPDPIHLDSARPVLGRYGLSKESLTDRLGGSP